MSSPACPRCTHTMTFVSESGGMPKLEHYRCSPCRITASIELSYEYDDQPADSPSLETSALCPHGMPLAENVCGPCSEGRPNRKETLACPLGATTHYEMAKRPEGCPGCSSLSRTNATEA